MRDSDEGQITAFAGLCFTLRFISCLSSFPFYCPLCLLSFHDTNPDCNPEIFPTEPLP